MHYGRLLNTGSTSLLPRKVCSIPECGRDHYAKGYCEYHYRQQHKGRKGKELARLPPPGRKVRERCAVRSCHYSHYAKGYCVRHYRQHWRAQRARAV